MSGNFYSILREHCRAPDDAVCLETESDRSMTYGELWNTSGRIAARLQQLGASTGDRVTVQVGKSPEALALYLACLRAGLVFMPLNTAYTRSELEFFVADARPAVFVCDPANEDQMTQIVQDNAQGCALATLAADGTGTLTAALETCEQALVVELTGTEQAAMIYTSGTTGKPKGVILSHDNLSSNSLVLHEIWGFKAGDVLLHALPIFHVHGLFVASNTALLNGSKMHFLSRFDPEQVLARLPDATVMMGVPTFYTRLLADERFDASLCQNMRLFISGSAPLLEETFREFETRTGHRILERYGMSETGMNTSNPLVGDRLPGTVGPALPGVEIRVCDDGDESVETGQVGGVQVKGPNVFTGYWGLPEKTAMEFTDDGFFRTGDQGRLDDKAYLSIVGREKDMVISGGYNVYPKEVELVLDDCEGVAESAVFGLPHADYGEAVTAVVVALDSANPPVESTMIAIAKEQLAAYKVPKKIMILDALPRNTMGKVQKAQLRNDYADLYQS